MAMDRAWVLTLDADARGKTEWNNSEQLFFAQLLKDMQIQHVLTFAHTFALLIYTNAHG